MKPGALLLGASAILVSSNAVAGDDEFLGDLDFFVQAGRNTLRGGQNGGAANTFTIGAESYITSWRTSIVMIHHEVAARIGGGDSGLDGVYREKLLVGLSMPDSTVIQPYLRGGLGGEYRSNDLFLHTHFELPEAQLGVVVIALPGVSLDAGGDLGLTLTGRYNTGNELRRELDLTPSGGAYASLHVWPLLARGEYRTYAQSHYSEAPEEWRAHVCALFPIFRDGWAGGFDGCFDATYVHGLGTRADGTTADSRSSYVGVSIGIGFAASESKSAATRGRPQPKPKPAEENPITPDTTPPDAPAPAAPSPAPSSPASAR